MEKRREVEFLIAGIFVILMLILVLGIIYFDLEENEKEGSYSYSGYERHSKLILDKNFYYGEESFKRVSYENGIYKEEIYQSDYSNFKNRVFLENEYYFEKTFISENLEN